MGETLIIKGSRRRVMPGVRELTGESIMKVFISHSSRDRWVARKISEDLIRAGIETFLDEKDISTGESIDDAIGQHLIESDELLVIISPTSLTSHWVFVEIGGAKALGKRVAPILFHVGSNELPPLLARYLARDLNDIESYYVEVKKRAAQPKSVLTTPLKAKRPRRRKTAKVSVGDKVQIAELSELTDEQKQSFPKWVEAMDKYAGKEAKITYIGDVDIAPGGQVYSLDIDDGEYGWASIWLTKL